MNRVYLRLDTERNISRCYEKSNQNRVNHDRIYNRAWTRIRFLFPSISSSNQIRQHWSNPFDSFDIHSFLSPSPSRITLRIREKEAEGGREDHLRELDVTGCTAAVPKDRRLEERFLCLDAPPPPPPSPPNDPTSPSPRFRSPHFCSSLYRRHSDIAREESLRASGLDVKE